MTRCSQTWEIHLGLNRGKMKKPVSGHDAGKSLFTRHYSGEAKGYLVFLTIYFSFICPSNYVLFTVLLYVLSASVAVLQAFLKTGWGVGFACLLFFFFLFLFLFFSFFLESPESGRIDRASFAGATKIWPEVRETKVGRG